MDNQHKKLPSSMALTPSRVQLLRSARNVWAVDAPEGMSTTDLLSHSIWKNKSADFRPGDTIEVLAEDFAYWARFLVIDANINGAKIKMLEEHAMSEAPSEKAIPIDGHVVKWKGPHDKWTVIRDTDNAKIQAGFISRDAAMVWLSGHLKALAA
jgi:hypothetical protein